MVHVSNNRLSINLMRCSPYCQAAYKTQLYLQRQLCLHVCDVTSLKLGQEDNIHNCMYNNLHT